MARTYRLKCSNANGKAEVLAVIEQAKAGVKSDKVHIIVGTGNNGKSTFAMEQASDECLVIPGQGELMETVTDTAKVVIVDGVDPFQLTTKNIDTLLSKKQTFIFVSHFRDIVMKEEDRERVVYHSFQEKVAA